MTYIEVRGCNLSYAIKAMCVRLCMQRALNGQTYYLMTQIASIEMFIAFYLGVNDVHNFTNIA
jgi:hypothetical protein